MKIAFIALRGIPLSDGISNYTESISPLLTDLDNEIYVYTSRRYGNKSGKLGNYNIITVPSFKSRYLEKMSIVFFASIHMMFQKYDIVHYHAFGPSIFAFMARITGKRVVIQSHGIEHKRAKWGFFAKLFLKVTEFMSIVMANKITVVSKTLQKYFFKTYKKRTIYIPTAVTIKPLVSPNLITQKFRLKGNDYYLFMARIVKEKGLHTLIDGFKGSETNKKLVIAGPLDLTDSYTSFLIEKARLDDRIIFVGEIQGIIKEELLSNAFVFCQPSELEGLSVSLLEAMSYKNCCLVSDIPENLEVSQNISFQFKNKDVLNCTEVINNIEKNIDKVNHYRQESIQYIIKNHLINNIVIQLNDMYHDVAKKVKKE